MKLHLTGTLLLAWVLSITPLAATAQETATQLKGPKSSTSQFSGLEYGPIDAQDTLWRIAERYRQNNNLTIYQVMVAIYELNPDAFEENNLNLLVDGAMLKLPSERYVARIDAEKARARAEQDDRSMSSQPSAPGNTLKNLKPSVPLVNQQDLSQTKNDIEQKITRLDEEQARQFDELRQQFAMSLENVQAILDENRKLYERVERVNDDLQTLKGQVEGDVKSQIDTQVALQQELLDMIKQEQAQRQSENESGFADALTSPMALIIGSGLLTVALLSGLAAWLLSRKNSPQPDTAPAQAPASEHASLDDDIDDLTTELSSDFDDKGELNDDDLFNDDDLLDDVLSSELEEALDDELENFAELDDDMLVPDDDEDDAFETGDSEIEQDELDSLFDEDDLSDNTVTPDADDDFDGIALASDEDDTDEYAQPEQADDADDVRNDDDSTDIESETDEQPLPDAVDEADEFDAKLTDDSVAEEDSLAMTQDADPDAKATELKKPEVDDEDDKPEISIDELLEDDEHEQSATSLSEDTEINEATLEKLDDEINQKNQAIDRLADNIIGEIEQLEMMGGMPADETDETGDDVVATEPQKPSSQSIQDLDALAGEIEDVEMDDIDTTENFSDPLSDDLIAELQAEDEAAEGGETRPSAQDELADELLAELGVEDDTGASAESARGADGELEDPLTDELLTELEANDGTDDDNAEPASPAEEAVSADDEHHDALTDELLRELDVDSSGDDAHSGEADTSLFEENKALTSDDDEHDTLTDELLRELDADSSGDDTQRVEADDTLAEDDITEAAEPPRDPLSDELQNDQVTDEVTDEVSASESDEVLPGEEDVASSDAEPLADQLLEKVDAEDADHPPSDTLAEASEDTEKQPETGGAVEAPGQGDFTQADTPDSADDVDSELAGQDTNALAGSSDPDTVSAADSDTAAEQVADEVTSASDSENADTSEATEATDALDDALDDFDRQMLDDLPSMADSDYTPTGKVSDDEGGSDYDDSMLDDAFNDVESFELEQEQDGVAPAKKSTGQEINELRDVPGLDDWLSDNDSEPEAEIFDELENSEFDDLLSSIESERDEAPKKPTLDNPDLDLNALLDESAPSTEDRTSRPSREEDFLDVEALIDDSLDEDNADLDETPLNLDVSLSEFSGIGDDDDVIDIDKDAGQNANLDLARAYIEMDDTDSARELLDEVLSKGDDAQKQEAKAILSSIS